MFVISLLVCYGVNEYFWVRIGLRHCVGFGSHPLSQLCPPMFAIALSSLSVFYTYNKMHTTAMQRFESAAGLSSSSLSLAAASASAWHAPHSTTADAPSMGSPHCR